MYRPVITWVIIKNVLNLVLGFNLTGTKIWLRLGRWHVLKVTWGFMWEKKVWETCFYVQQTGQSSKRSTGFDKLLEEHTGLYLIWAKPNCNKNWKMFSHLMKRERNSWWFSVSIKRSNPELPVHAEVIKNSYCLQGVAESGISVKTSVGVCVPVCGRGDIGGAGRSFQPKLFYEFGLNLLNDHQHRMVALVLFFEASGYVIMSWYFAASFVFSNLI